ncbi:AMP-binding protein [Sorangium sp. So ce295]|jgi:2,3-dihydroxybenzoate-AMP ligase|uniref:(2,3-dihydroxybenzoyl)adenylate synthase n=1 Tax=Sorangium sp. So ce295 TaxID=3133295 RepID=UPI003F5FBBBF
MSDGFEFPRWPESFAAAYRAKGYWTGETLGGMLRRVARSVPDRVAVTDGPVNLTYAELDARADRLADGLAALGLSPGDRVVVQLPNTVQFVEVIFALFRLGAIPVFALPSDRISEITHIFQISGAKAYVIRDKALGFDYRMIAEEVVSRISRVERVIVVGDPGAFVPFETLYGRPNERPERAGSEPALVTLSGGSTALPKLIARTHDDYLYSVRASAEICGLTPESVYLCALPAGHNFTLSSPGILGTLCAGGRVVMTTDPSGATAFSLIEREKVTFAALVPSLALAWLHAERTCDLSSLRFLQVGGAKLSAEMAARLESSLGCQLQQVYGMSEGLVCYTRLGDPSERVLNTQGRPISVDDEVRIVDQDDQPVPDGTPGELLVRGPYTIRGYLNAEEHNGRVFTADGFYRTGDIVARRDDGYLVVSGRSKDQVNRGGEKIAAEEVEGHLLAHPRVREAAIVSIPDVYLGEASCAFVVADPEGEVTAAQIRAFVRGRGVAAYKVPDQVRFVPSLPKTTVGKIDRKELRKQHGGSAAALP